MPLYKTPSGTLLFIHVPKTGGSSIEKHLRSAFSESWHGEHPMPSIPVHAQHYHGELLASLPKPHYAFMMVRHPVDRIVSEWKWQSRRLMRFYRRLSFSRWLHYNLTAAARDLHYRDNHFRPQVEFKAFDAEVFRLEDGLLPVLRQLKERTGLPLPVQDIYEKKSREDAMFLSSEDYVRITDFYRDDFHQFGYQ
jgi:hypothetical protein